jgi:hypothetical protein
MCCSSPVFGEALTEWLARIRHSVKPSMATNWQNYMTYYVIPYSGACAVQEVDGSVCDALYARLMAEGRVKAKPRMSGKAEPVHTRRLSVEPKTVVNTHRMLHRAWEDFTA